MRRIYSLFLVFVSVPALSQEQKQKPVLSFESINQVGLLAGEKGNSFQLQTVNGFRFNNWFAGAGASVDHYMIRTVPVFLDIRKHFGPAAQIVGYLDVGRSFPWQKENSDWFVKRNFPGWYYDLGMAYRMSIGKESLIF